MPSYPHITTVLVFYRNADGKTRIARGATLQGAEEWSEAQWLRIVGATSYIQANWLRIEATNKPYLRLAIDSPLAKTLKLINPPESELCD